MDSLSIDELQSSLLVHEQHINDHVCEEEQALKVTYEGCFGSRGRGQQSFDISTVECYNCHGLEHYQFECPKRENDRANYP